jgi:CHRD domain-containing protein
MQRRTGLVGAMAGALALALAIALVGEAPSAQETTKVVKERAVLKGENEMPPGDPDGSGTARVGLRQQKGAVCFTIRFQGIEKPIMGHIHRGRAGVVGPIVVEFFETDAGRRSPIQDCVKASKRLIKSIAGHPQRFYVNIHTPSFPGGAIRGQLKRSGAGGGSGGGSQGGGLPY